MQLDTGLNFIAWMTRAPRAAVLLAAAVVLALLALAVSTVLLRRGYRRWRTHGLKLRARHHALAQRLYEVHVDEQSDEQQYWLQLRNTAAPVMISTSSGEIVAASQQLLDMLGYSSEAEFTTVRAVDLYADIRERDRKLMAALRANGEIRNSRFRLKRRDGSAIQVLASIRVHGIKDGKTFYEGVLADITPLVEAVEQREKLEAQLGLARRLEAIGQLAAGIAHELNTPIQFIGDNVHFLKRTFARLCGPVAVPGSAGAGPNPPERVPDAAALRAEATDAFDAALEGIERVTEIVRAMKEFAHPGEGEFTSCDLNQIVRSALVVARNEYKHVASVTTELGPLGAIDCRKAEISKVLLNLIINAAHAIDSAMHGGRPGPGIITVRSWEEPGFACLSIEDTGCGIPKSVITRIFDPFFTTKPIGRGTGQGLAIARDIVQRHDGQLEVASTVGMGTVFTLRLPLPPVQSLPGNGDPSLAESLIG